MDQSSSYKKLRAKWYAKLKREGFEDIETSDGQLKEWSSTLLGNRKKVFSQNGGWEAKQEYYRLAAQFLHEYKFETKRQQTIWEYHANGISGRNIVKLLKKVRVKTNREDIRRLVRKLRYKMYDMYLSRREPQHE